jgi:hypothetical protein
MRDPLHPLILSTLAHLAALEFSPSPLYSYIIVISTTLSVVWHLYEEPQNLLCAADYFMAAVWFAYDTIMSVTTSHRYKIVFLNLICMILNVMANYLPNYVVAHTFWHLLSATRAIAVAYFLSEK